MQGRPVWLKVARRDRLDLARRARDLDLVVGEESLEAPLLGDAGRCSAPSLESLRLAQRAVDDVGVGRPERAAGGAELVAEDLDAPYVEAQGSADIAARENVAQEREVADEVLVLDLEQEGAVLLVRLDAEERVISLLDGDDVAEVLLEQRSEVLDLGGRVDGAAGADGDEAVGLRRRLELARLRLPAPLGGVESDEVDGDVIRSWELYGATAGVVLEEGSCLALAAEKATQTARDVPMMGTLIALACCASPPGVFLINWRTSVTSAVLFWMSGMCEPSRAASATCSRRFVPRSVPAAAAAAICAASTIMVSPSLASSSLTRALASSPSRRHFTPSLSSASSPPSQVGR